MRTDGQRAAHAAYMREYRQRGGGGRDSRHASTLGEWLECHLTKSDTGCWDWTGHIDTRSGYGTLYWRGKKLFAHRAAYSELVGEIPEGFHIHHSCRSRSCVNPDHLTAILGRDHKKLEHGAQLVRLPFLAAHELHNPVPVGFA